MNEIHRRRSIVLSGARMHNLKGIDCRFPKGALTVVTGKSGSGKSSLVMDTLYAEGFRRYTEALSTYARRFLERMPRPELDYVRGIQPAIAFGLRNRTKNARSTVGTATEIVDLLRVLFSRAGSLYCEKCSSPVGFCDGAAAADTVLERLSPGDVVLVCASKDMPAAERERNVTMLVRDGYGRYVTQSGAIRRLACDRVPRRSTLDIVIDRFRLSGDNRSRIAEAIDQGFRIGDGTVTVRAGTGDRYPRADNGLRFRRGDYCPVCDRILRRPEPPELSFNSPVGACPSCSGFGRIPVIDPGKVIPDPSLSIAGGAVLPFRSDTYSDWLEDLLEACRSLDIPVDAPWSTLPAEHKEWIWSGRGEWYGLTAFFDHLERKRYKMHIRILLSRYRSFLTCPDCSGGRLKAEANRLRLGGRTLVEVCRLPAEELQAWIYGLTPDHNAAAVRDLLKETRRRIDYLVRVGLEYVTLDRQTRTLSGGEAQRINLASALGAELYDTLYVLDEPSIGLHPADLDKLLSILDELKLRGNTVVVVEHEQRVIDRADHIIELGPGSGGFGGRLVYEGPPPSPACGQATGAGDRPGNERFEAPAGSGAANGKPGSAGWLKIRGATANNLKTIDVDIPLGTLTCISGVSGSGKSTLLESVLYGGLAALKGLPVDECRRFSAIFGHERLQGVELVDQAPIARSGRSIPLTHLKLFQYVRKLLASTEKARELGLEPGFFSFNRPGGRCEHCEGNGVVSIDMQFMGEVTIPCEHCGGSRFGPLALSISVRGFTVADILEMTVDEGLEVFGDERNLAEGLSLLTGIGLGYLKLGQSTSTLSAGESQRLKLAGRLLRSARRRGRTSTDGRGDGILYLLDEPTTGLHRTEISMLLGLLYRLIERGATVVVVEHDLDVISSAGWVIDLGPGGGVHGGRVLAAGPPADIAGNRLSRTGRYLAERLGI